jgi:YrbI family 3-deoxy-D-manno-octulosonate 8-phosphate phosphatase
MKKSDTIKKAKKIKLLLTDVDGVLTDGNMYFVENQRSSLVEIKGFHAQDGIGLRLLRQFGIQTGMITGRISPAAEGRAKSLNMKYVYQGFLEKLEPFEQIAKKSKLKYSQIAFIGDDLTDLPVLKKAGLACATHNAVDEVKNISHFVTKKKGGEGAVREICDFILKAQGKWPQILKNSYSSNWAKIPKEKLIIVNAKH